MPTTIAIVTGDCLEKLSAADCNNYIELSGRNVLKIVFLLPYRYKLVCEQIMLDEQVPIRSVRVPEYVKSNSIAMNQQNEFDYMFIVEIGEVKSVRSSHS